ncbi:hypothetical protein Q2K19_32140 [Micromonospora soli]|uniref:hypothetical protein n=1 Tax=Micromonospora sp. NBRC 110009 TaxID=3061627 RepID=UPI002672D6A2|nr:hypothetical protein [Micromonospora sp. NBRC 110009]WKT98735.1 hypothetical protein Q2K19_32140 [Micromonospora sp. NBRC 110009]
MKHRAPPPPGLLSKAKRHPAKVIAATFAVLLGLYFCGNLLGDDQRKTTPSVSASAGHIAAIPFSSAPTSAGPSSTPNTTAKPTPRPTRSSPQSTMKHTTRPSSRNGVHPGASCKAAGAMGRTSTGKLMMCKRSAGDNRLRWRPA